MVGRRSFRERVEGERWEGKGIWCPFIFEFRVLFARDSVSARDMSQCANF